MAIDLGDGLTPVRCNGREFSIDLMGWMKWWADSAQQYADNPYGFFDAVRDRLRGECGVEINCTQADGMLHAIGLAVADLKKKQQEQRMSLSSTESTLSG